LCPKLRDLSPLSRTGVVELSLFQTDADLSTLRAPELTSLTIRHPALRDGLHALSPDLPLRELTLMNRPGDRRLTGIERLRGLRRLSLVGAPDNRDIAALAQLPHLTELTVTQPRTLEDLTALAELTTLRTLSIVEPPEGPDDAEPALIARLKNVRVGVVRG
jgi:hypothetical protein